MEELKKELICMKYTIAEERKLQLLSHAQAAAVFLPSYY
jgi:hypothetical protein